MQSSKYYFIEYFIHSYCKDVKADLDTGIVLTAIKTSWSDADEASIVEEAEAKESAF